MCFSPQVSKPPGIGPRRWDWNLVEWLGWKWNLQFGLQWSSARRKDCSMHKIPFLGEKFFTLGAIPHTGSVSCLHFAKLMSTGSRRGTRCQGAALLRFPKAQEIGEDSWGLWWWGSLSSWLAGASQGRSLLSLVAALFVQRAAGCVTLWIYCWHRGTRRSVWCWPTPRSGGCLVSLFERQCIHQGYLPFEHSQCSLKSRSALGPALGLVDTSTSLHGSYSENKSMSPSCWSLWCGILGSGSHWLPGCLWRKEIEQEKAEEAPGAATFREGRAKTGTLRPRLAHASWDSPAPRRQNRTQPRSWGPMAASLRLCLP